MIQDPVDPFGDDSTAKMRSGRVAIADRPIEAGVYSWGWVEYKGYGSDSKPTEISVVMLNEPKDQKAMASAKKILTRPRWRSLLACYGPLVIGFLAMCFGDLSANGWIGQFALLMAGISGWQIWKHSQVIRGISDATEVWGNRDLENYIAGREFLRALSHEDLPAGDLFAYFNLRASAAELKNVISDTRY